MTDVADLMAEDYRVHDFFQGPVMPLEGLGKSIVLPNKPAGKIRDKPNHCRADRIPVELSFTLLFLQAGEEIIDSGTEKKKKRKKRREKKRSGELVPRKKGRKRRTSCQRIHENRAGLPP